METTEKLKIEDYYTIKVGNLYVKDYQLRPEDMNSNITFVTDKSYARFFTFGTHEIDAKDNEQIKATIERLLEITNGTLILTRTKTITEKTVKEVASPVDMNKE